MLVVADALSEPASPSTPVGLRYGTPCAFDGCSGFLHAADGRVGIVLCSPWGFEDLVIRKSWRLLAEAIAGAGWPCLRFDYPGTGDSLGAALDVDTPARWVESIHAAADFLRATCGVERIVFLGQSLGALLAIEAAASRGDVAGLQLIAPVARGRAYVRELSATSRMVAERMGVTLDLAPGEGLTVVGFGLSQAMTDALKQLDATTIEGSTPGAATIFDSPDRKVGSDIADALRARGVAVHVEPVEPYHLMVSDATEIQPLPVSATQVLAELARQHPREDRVADATPHPRASLAGGTFVEEPLRFGAEGALFGILTHPAHPRDGAPAIVLLNRGLNPHVGWRRGTVDHARALAAAGSTCLRIDIAGLGESRDEPGRPVAKIYSDALVADVRAAIDVLAARGHARIALAGVCSGAYTALTTAQCDPRVTDVIAFNPQRFVWNPAESMEDVIRYGLRSMEDYVGDIRRAGALRKLMRSRKRIVPALGFLARKRIRGAMAHVPLTLRALGSRRSMAARVTRFFKTFAERGTRLSLVFTEGDPSLDELRQYFGPHGRDLRFPDVTVTILADTDHNFTTRAASDFMLDHMREVLGGSGAEEPARGDSRASGRLPRAAAPKVCPT